MLKKGIFLLLAVISGYAYGQNKEAIFPVVVFGVYKPILISFLEWLKPLRVMMAVNQKIPLMKMFHQEQRNTWSQ